MGLHVHAHLSLDEAVEYCRAVQPAMMKWMAPTTDVLRRCRAVSPKTKHVLRPYWGDQRLGDQHDAFVRHSMDRVREFGTLIDWYEGYNEFECRDHQLLRAFCSAELDRAKKLNAMGVGCALGGFSTGAFDAAGKAYDAVRPMLVFLNETGPRNVWHSHEYAGPYMGYMTRTADGRNQWPKPPDAFNGWSTDGDQFWPVNLDGWLTLRYRMLRARLVADGLSGVRMIFTETGVDDTNPRPGGANRKGWRDYAGSEWAHIPGQGDYADQQYWYGWHLSHDPYVLGWCDFGWGSEDPAWWSFSLDKEPAMLARVVATQARLPVGHFGTTTEPVPGPVTPDPTPAPGGGTKMIEGIDVSRWQGEVDWRKARAAGVLFAWIKASEGSDWTDPEYADNAKCAGGAGLVWGPYHYYRNSIDPVAQATQFAKVVLNAGGSNRVLPPAIDLEDTKSPVDPTALRTFVEAVAARLGRPIIYTGAWWMRLQDAGALAFLAAYPLWLAHYGTSSPVVPAPWRDWDVWQWASKGSGSAFGASSQYIDRNRFRGTLNALVGLARPVGASEPVNPTPPIDELIAAAVAEHAAHGVRLNPTAGLQREMLADGLVPTTNEVTFTWPGGSVVWQRGEALATAGGWLFYWDQDAGRVVKVRVPA